MPLHISRNLKARIPILFHEQHLTVDNICHILGMKKTLVYKALQYFHVYGITHNPHAHRRGCHRVLSLIDIKFIASLVERRHCIYLDEIKQALSEQRGCDVSVPTLSRTLQRLHFSQKSAYMNTISDIVTNPDMLMFVDEAACNCKTSGRMNGWATVGQCC
ncbi:hypothetical protein EDB92DRAFT_1982888 [Lactarius akahatsu]|uniref:Transposase n=1 Tax=Lactarius akahatsu TaxID=416441 RepID=A0AAD4LQ44_9AGAM|nr:hypothetical protein EDB92DRAFT_1982888 [Lactarius akahatsu]